MSLRLYQTQTQTLVREQFIKGHREVLVWLATGAGKTVIFCNMIVQLLKAKKRVMILVRGRKLVDQASQRLFQERVPHGVMMAKHWNYKPHLPVQVCSVDTLIAREDERPTADVIIIDETDVTSTSPEAKLVLAHYPKAHIIHFTATPWVRGGLSAQVVVHPITMLDLIAQGFLTPFKYFAPSEPDLTGVKIDSKTHDFQSTQLESRMVQGQLTGKIIDHYGAKAKGLPAMLFAVNVNHSKMLTEKFIAAGIKAVHIDNSTKEKEREEAYQGIKSGKFEVLSNVGIAGRGVDIPALRVGILARPTTSRNLFVQQSGRLTRLYSGKDHSLLFDHAGNIRRHGFPTDEPAVDLSGRIPSERSALESKICKTCFAVYRGEECPDCGTPAPKAGREILETDDELIEITPEAKDAVGQWLDYLEVQRKKKNRKNGWQYYKLVEKFGKEQSRPYLPEWWVRLNDEKEAGLSANPFAGSPFNGARR